MTLVRKVCRILDWEWQVTMNHVFREGNRCADFLASYALSLDVGYHSLAVPPTGLGPLLSEDVVGSGSLRFCWSNG
ncbi:hypothetical protein K1719_020968 [Acacia pycnantha]|nr:hypothetical protein K1719_020968 [Acacia pycnantha]